MLLASAVVVWEWLNEHGRWRPYSPVVSHHIEAVIRSDPRGGSVVLGQVDSRLSPYIIDLHSMHQFRQDTGTLRPVRRSFYDPTSAPGQGWLWEWENDVGSWTAYDTEVGIAIQAARDRLQPWLDLSPLGFCYLIDFQSMTQINGQTQRRRRIQRRSDLAYPLVSGALPRSQAWGAAGGGAGGPLAVGVSGSSGGNGGVGYPSGALSLSSLAPLGQSCTCQQCMLVLSVKTSTMAQTLGRKPPQARPPSPKSTLGRRSASSPPNSYSYTLPHPSRSVSPRKSRPSFNHSLSLLGPASAALSRPSPRPAPPSLPSTPPPPAASAAPGSVSSAPAAASTPLVPTATLITVATSSPAAPGPRPAAPIPPRASLVGLSRPALQRIAMAQSRALIASGVPTVPVKNLNGSSPVHPALAGITGILMSAAALPVCLTRPPKLVLHPPPVSKSDIKPIPGLSHCCRKTSKKQARKGKTPEEVVKKYLQKVRSPPEEDCTICMEPLGGASGYRGPGVGSISRGESVGRLSACGHEYHLQCLVAMYNNGNKDGSLQCPTCKTIYGVKTGNQPPGKMEYHVIPHSLPGHPDCKTIRIIYNIPPGIQGPEHPNPGKPFTARGFPRHCYLPDSEKGRKVLRLLLVAWDRRLVFSVGTSSTTGESDTVIWNEVHHKTEFGSNLTGHGYPDPGHLDNVLEELRIQGIAEDESLQRD
ncbi:E3 ubiquitin-protein ligase DTX4-like [Conger conger]|uniref:E3 ubiquitin-protein ligase DTX4-like n=1 Tax=Conger conger TaxID=82655 RepID=UPI002A598716|nr:E3 ubiquitin-protein ligase DTX4-like [Conger conger]XP_061101486.1 E3 ubiquitin-protein ligase DTX4-like [Conger conger]XP_061101487.1 E3 ubiquitin-protein ligase DTX4-like [Conger conger]